MLKLGRQLFIKLTYVFIDIFFLGLAIFLAAMIRQNQTLPFEANIFNLFFDPINPYRFLFIFWIMVTVIINNAHGLYQTKREIFEAMEIWEVIRSAILSSLIVIVAIFILKVEDFPRSILILTTTFIVTFFSVWRILKRVFVEYIVSRGYNNYNTLIIGAGKIGIALTKEIERFPSLGIRIIGYLDDFKTDKDLPKGKVLGKIEDFARIARSEFIDKIFITVHHDSRVFMQLLEDAKKIGIAVRVIPQGFEMTPSDFKKYNIGFIPVLEYCEGQIYRSQGGKRIFDLFVAIMLLLLLFPALVVLAILIKLDSPGPVFYFSRRYGRGGRIFDMYKFRSMVQDAEQLIKNYQDKNEVDGPIFKIRKDPRTTKMGKFLRKYSLDELPQIINVIKGEMSLVGPRPLPISQVEREDLKQLQRLEVRPGITGLWQIRGRSDTSFARLVKWDVWYINNWTFWLDLNILYQTLPAVLKGKGAY